MPKVTVKITRFDGGISEDKRSGWVGSGGNFTTNKFSLVKHFDVFTNPKKLVPYHKTEADEDKSYDIVKFLYAPYDSSTTTNHRLYGFGISTGTTGRVFFHDSSIIGFGWNIPSGGGDAATGREEEVFFHYKNYLYWWATGKLMRYSTATGDQAIYTYQTIAFSSIAQPVHHPADDIAYFFYDNKVAKLDDTSWTLAALTLPSNLKIVAGAAYGNYLAIACISKQRYGEGSVVYLWDRDSTITTLTERISFGEGQIVHLANLNNKLIAVMNFFLDNVAGAGIGRGKVLIKQASGNFAVPLNEITVDEDYGGVEGTALLKTRFITDNKLYFPAKLPLKGDDRLGIWVVDEFGRVSLDFVEEDIAANKSYEGIYRLGNYWWIAHSDDGSVQRSDDGKAYSTTLASVYESLVFTAGDSSITKKLIGVEVMFEKLPTAGQIVLKYRIDGATSWTTIFTHTTDNSISHEAINIESSGDNLKEYKEVEFQINSTGGAVITGLRFVSDITNKGRLF